MSKYAPDLVKDRFYVWLNDYHWVPMIALGCLLFAVGGVRFVLWGIFLRVVADLHITWLVNSATHMWGSRRFPTPDDSRNNWLIALITSGEGLRLASETGPLRRFILAHPKSLILW